jgi:hypothetical protein
LQGASWRCAALDNGAVSITPISFGLNPATGQYMTVLSGT